MSRPSRAAFSLLLILALPGPQALLAQTPSPERPTLDLSLDDAVKRALENNVDIAVERYNPDLSAESVRAAAGAYDPFLFSTVTTTSRTSPGSNFFSGGSKVDTDTLVYNFGASQRLPTGGNFSLSFNNNKNDTNNVFETFNPSFNSSLTLSITQPLLQNFRVDAYRQNLRVAKKNREISEVQFRQTVTNTVAGVKNLYYDLLYAIDNLDAQRRSLDLAKKFLNENEIMVRVGTKAPLEVVAAESEVALREEAFIVAENSLLEAEDAVKRSIFPKNDPATWALRINPTDHPTAEPFPVDLDAAVRNALEKRTDVVAARKSLESADYSVQYFRSQALPQLDLIASYGGTGLGGTQVRDLSGNPLPTPIVGGYNDAVSSVFGRDFPTWTVGVNVSYAIRNRQAAAASAQARVSKEQALVSMRRLELQVAQEVRSAARAVETNLKRVASTRAARVLQERRLDAEEKRFAAGMSTNFFVTQAQRDLVVSQVAELRAVADYRKSLVDFERVQESGGGSGVVFVSSSARPSN